MVQIELPWPPKELLPNNKLHWAKKARIIKRYRHDCGWVAKTIKPTSYEFTLTFYPPDKRKRDRDSMIASFKAGQDGLADSWGVDDNIFRVSYMFGEPVKDGKVILTILEK